MFRVGAEQRASKIGQNGNHVEEVEEKEHGNEERNQQESNHEGDGSEENQSRGNRDEKRGEDRRRGTGGEGEEAVLGRERSGGEGGGEDGDREGRDSEDVDDHGGELVKSPRIVSSTTMMIMMAHGETTQRMSNPVRSKHNSIYLGFFQYRNNHITARLLQ